MGPRFPVFKMGGCWNNEDSQHDVIFDIRYVSAPLDAPRLEPHNSQKDKLGEGGKKAIRKKKVKNLQGCQRVHLA